MKPYTDNPSDGGVSWNTVLDTELDELRCSRKKRDIPVPVKDADPFGSELLGLALSGGGIRSATFCLGVIQYLASRGYLKHFDYISTVSGGGYISGWLISWIRRLNLDDVSRKLKPNQVEEAKEITFLRNYSNYLTPKASAFSADTWVSAVIWARNTALNLATFVLLLMAVILIVRFGSLGWARLGLKIEGFTTHCLIGFASAALLFPIVLRMKAQLSKVSGIALKDNLEWDPDEDGPRHVVRRLPLLLLSSLVWTFWLWSAQTEFLNSWMPTLISFVPLTLGFFLLQSGCQFVRCYRAKHKKERSKDHFPLLLWLMGPMSAGLVTALALRLIPFFISNVEEKQQPWFAFAWGPPLVITAFAAGVIVHAGIMGRDLPDAAREWLARLRAFTLIMSAGWIAIVGGTLYGPYLMLNLGEHALAKWAAGLGWLLTTISGLIAARSARTSGKEAEPPATSRRTLPTELAARIAPFVFMAGFLLMISLLTHLVLAHNLYVTGGPVASEARKFTVDVEPGKVTVKPEESSAAFPDDGLFWYYGRYWEHLQHTKLSINSEDREMWFFSGLAPLLALCLGGGVLLSRRVDINDFSLHHFYKNRLVRCYLGASRCEETRDSHKRDPSPFTGFDDNDDQELTNFRACQEYGGPYPIINTTMNVSSGGQLRYQERKAISFAFTPAYSGYSTERNADLMRLKDKPAGAGVSLEDEKQIYAYRPTQTCATDGVKLGMATAISGAAVSPNMGYHTSTPVAFLLTIFNVRLGWWFGNPMLDACYRKSSPDWGLTYTLLGELFGMATGDSDFVNLSDGGHFDNMGIYELVRRRCRYIICCDAEQDPGMKMNGIGNAIRRCRTDFGVEIDLPLDRMKQVDGFSRVHCVVGTISYPEHNSAYRGYILYLKSSLTGDEPSDVLEYRARQSSFPHQTTGDQWFDESQFESYRRLGLHIAESAMDGVRSEAMTGSRLDFFERLHDLWYPSNPAVDAHAAEHAEIYGRLMQAIGGDQSMAALDGALFFDWDKSEAAKNRSASYACDAIIQLMERVFYDLDLGNPANQKHPYVLGWLQIFRHWASGKEFRTAWSATKRSYPNKFQVFYREVLQGEQQHSTDAKERRSEVTEKSSHDGHR